MRASFSLAVFLSLAHLAGAVGAARAQNEAVPPNGAPGNPNPVDGAPVNGAPADGAPNANPQKLGAPKDRAAQRRAQSEMRLRALMNNLGIEAAASQDALIAYLAEDESGKIATRGAARRLEAAVRTETPPDRMRDLIAIYKAALDADRERRHAAQNALDAKIGFSLSPRLEAILWLLGVLGDGQNGLPLNLPRPFRNPPADNQRGDNQRGDNRRGDNPRGDNAALQPGDNAAPADNLLGANPGAVNPAGAANPPGLNTPPGPNNARNGRPREAGMRRSGTMRGLVTGKADGWIELRADDGKIERFWPLGTGGEVRIDATPNPSATPNNPPNPASEGQEKDDGARKTRFHREMLQSLAQVKIGDRVRLDWQGNWPGSERKRVVSLDILQPLASTPELPEPALNPGADAATTPRGQSPAAPAKDPGYPDP